MALPETRVGLYMGREAIFWTDTLLAILRTDIIDFA